MKPSYSRLAFVVAALLLGTCFAIAADMMAAMAPLTGSIPSTPVRDLPNGNGSTGSLACQFLGANRPATKWWVGGTTQPANTYNVSPSPAPSITGFNRDAKVWVRFAKGTGFPATAKLPPDTQVTIVADKTVVLNVEYK